MTNKKRIGIITSGGDCAGLNAAIRAVVYAGTKKGYEVVGIKYATRGVIEEEKQYVVFDPNNFDQYLMKRGGTVLKSINKSKEYKKPLPDGTDKAANQEVIDGLKSLGINSLISIGGDGSFAIMSKILEGSDIQLVTIPKTIDNDVGITEKCIGFDSAIEVATQAMDDLQATAESHSRVMVLEVMGRDAGNLAINTGIASGADVILLPEIPYNVDKVAEKLKHVHEVEGRNYALIVVAEAIKDSSGSSIEKEIADGQKRYGGAGEYIAKQISQKTGYEVRHTVLGHTPRGVHPNANDRILASALGAHAVELIEQGKTNRMVAWVANSVKDVAIKDALEHYQSVDINGTLVKTARLLGVCLGD